MNHGIRVDLAHVPPSVALLCPLDVEEPFVTGRAGQRDARVPSYHVVVDRQYGLGVDSDPGDLQGH